MWQPTVSGSSTARSLETYLPPPLPYSPKKQRRLNVIGLSVSVTGIDLFGPFWLKYGRNKKIKSLGAVFTGAIVRAIHLEIVQDLSSEVFLHALRRFAAHHGWPTMTISDNGSSFVGAENGLKRILQDRRQNIEDFAVTHKLKWKFNTPSSPHQGGFFESMVKLTKKALRIIVGQQTLSWKCQLCLPKSNAS